MGPASGKAATPPCSVLAITSRGVLTGLPVRGDRSIYRSVSLLVTRLPRGVGGVALNELVEGTCTRLRPAVAECVRNVSLTPSARRSESVSREPAGCGLRRLRRRAADRRGGTARGFCQRRVRCPVVQTVPTPRPGEGARVGVKQLHAVWHARRIPGAGGVGARWSRPTESGLELGAVPLPRPSGSTSWCCRAVPVPGRLAPTRS